MTDVSPETEVKEKEAEFTGPVVLPVVEVIPPGDVNYSGFLQQQMRIEREKAALSVLSLREEIDRYVTLTEKKLQDDREASKKPIEHKLGFLQKNKVERVAKRFGINESKFVHFINFIENNTTSFSYKEKKFKGTVSRDLAESEQKVFLTRNPEYEEATMFPKYNPKGELLGYESVSFSKVKATKITDESDITKIAESYVLIIDAGLDPIKTVTEMSKIFYSPYAAIRVFAQDDYQHVNPDILQNLHFFKLIKITELRSRAYDDARGKNEILNSLNKMINPDVTKDLSEENIGLILDLISIAGIKGVEDISKYVELISNDRAFKVFSLFKQSIGTNNFLVDFALEFANTKLLEMAENIGPEVLLKRAKVDIYFKTDKTINDVKEMLSSNNDPLLEIYLDPSKSYFYKKLIELNIMSASSNFDLNNFELLYSDADKILKVISNPNFMDFLDEMNWSLFYLLSYQYELFETFIKDDANEFMSFIVNFKELNTEISGSGLGSESSSLRLVHETGAYRLFTKEVLEKLDKVFVGGKPIADLLDLFIDENYRELVFALIEGGATNINPSSLYNIYKDTLEKIEETPEKLLFLVIAIKNGLQLGGSYKRFTILSEAEKFGLTRDSYFLNEGASYIGDLDAYNELEKEDLVKFEKIAKEVGEDFAKFMNNSGVRLLLEVEENRMGDLNRVIGLFKNSDVPINIDLMMYKLCRLQEAGLARLETVASNLGDKFSLFLQPAGIEMILGLGEQDVENFSDVLAIFNRANTQISLQLIEKVFQTKGGKIIETVRDITTDETLISQAILDIICYEERLETNKTRYISGALKNGISENELQSLLMYLRWLPDAEISQELDLADIGTKYLESMNNISTTFGKTFPNSEKFTENELGVDFMQEIMGAISSELNLETRSVVLGGLKVQLPTEFIRQYSKSRKGGDPKPFPSELARYLIDKSVSHGSALMVENLLLMQVSNTVEGTGSRSGDLTPEKLFSLMEENIEASLETWDESIEFQSEETDSPLFLIANERTGPGDLAAEYLPANFGQEHSIALDVDHERLMDWFLSKREEINVLYMRLIGGEDIGAEANELLSEVIDFKTNKIIPIYRLKIPSSLNASSEIPKGIDEFIDFLKLISLVNGRALFMDESTTNRGGTPRSIECLYNQLQRQSEELGGVNIRLLGQVDGSRGQNGTSMVQIPSAKAKMRVGLINPWPSSNKSVTDDRTGFVPELESVDGKKAGVITVRTPSYTTFSPFGTDTIQGYWKRMIATEVAARFDQYTETEGKLKRREQLKQRIPESAILATQEELTKDAFSKEYSAVTLDLDVLLTETGEIEKEVVERLRKITDGGGKLVITASGAVERYLPTFKDMGVNSENITIVSRGGALMQKGDGAVIEKIEIVENEREKLLAFMKANFPNTVLEEDSTMIEIVPPNGEDQDILEGKVAAFIRKEGLGLDLVSYEGRLLLRDRKCSKSRGIYYLESQTGVGLNDILKLADLNTRDDRSILLGRGAFSLGGTQESTIYSISYGDGKEMPKKVLEILDKVNFVSL